MKGAEILRQLWSVGWPLFALAAILISLRTWLLRGTPHDWKGLAVAIPVAVVSLSLFLAATVGGLVPLGETVGRGLVSLGNRPAMVVLVFVIGYLATLVEPALRVLAAEVEEVTVGGMPRNVLVHVVAFGFAAGMSLGVLKILLPLSMKAILVPGCLLVLLLIVLAPERTVGIALDCASATTGPVNIPLNMALAIGLSKIVAGADPLTHGFGLIGLTSCGAVVSVLVFGVLFVR